MTRHLLGAILAGGQSRRFGSDKALAPVDGRSLMAHAVAALSAQVDAVVSCGRPWGAIEMLDDRPAPHLGPLGGLNAALHAASARGYEAVLSVSVDSYPIPDDLAEMLGGGGARHLAGHFLIGVWPASLAPQLEAHLAAGHRSVRSWIAACGAQSVLASREIRNINTPDALMAQRSSQGFGL